MEYTFLYCKEYVGARINTLMSISDRLRPSNFSRKMEKARPMKVEMDGNVVHFLPESAFLLFDVIIFIELFPICTLTWPVNNHVSLQEKV